MPLSTGWRVHLRSRESDLVLGALLMILAGFAAGVVVAGPFEVVFVDRQLTTRSVALLVSMVLAALIVFDLASRGTSSRWLAMVIVVGFFAIVLAIIDPFWMRDEINELIYFFWTGSVLGGLVGLVGGTGERLIRRGIALALIWVVTLLALAFGFIEYEQFDIPFYVI